MNPIKYSSLTKQEQLALNDELVKSGEWRRIQKLEQEHKDKEQALERYRRENQTTRRKKIQEEMEKHFDSFEHLVYNTLTDDQLDEIIYKGHNCYGKERIPFTLWTQTRVYFPTIWDALEEVSSAPRDPCGERVEHCGGG